VNTANLDTDTAAGRADRYRRQDLAERISLALVRPAGNESLVVALDGQWGSGKTWLLEEVVRCLAAGQFSTSTQVVRFSPWQVGEESDLVLDFLIQLALELSPVKGVQEKAKTAGKTLLVYARALRYGRLLKYVPIPVIDKIGDVIGEVADSVSAAIDEAEEALGKGGRPSLADARNQVEAAIADLGKRIVVLIDDVDRLRPREVRTLIQLVKSVADFSRMSFLLAFDAKQVAVAVAEDGNVDTGMRYLEKIVQLSIRVPLLDKTLLHDEVQERLTGILSTTGHVLASYEKPLLSDATRLVANMCDTPRDVVRWANHVTWAAMSLSSSVNMADLCVIEALQLKTRRTTWDLMLSSSLVGNEQLDVSLSLQGWGTWTGTTQAQQLENEVKALRQGFESTSQNLAFDFLFPQVVGGKEADTLNAQEYRRLGASSIWHHYRQFGTGRDPINGAVVEDWLKNPMTLKASLEAARSNSSEEERDLLFKIARFISYDSLPSEPSKVAPLFTSIAHVDEAIEDRGGFVSSNLIGLLEELLLAQAAESDGKDVLMHLATVPLHLQVAAIERLQELANGGSPQAGKAEAAKRALLHVRPVVVTRLDAAIDDRSILNERGPIYLLHAHSRLRPPADTALAVERLLPDDESLHTLLAEVANWSVERFHSPLLVDLFSEPRLFIQRVEGLHDAKLEGYVESLRQVPEDRLNAIEKFHVMNKAVAKSAQSVGRVTSGSN
jgi:hypothetical protein